MLKHLILAVAVTSTVGCGDQPSSLVKGDAARLNDLEFTVDNLAFDAELPARPRLSFRSEWQKVHAGSLGLALKLGWSMLGVEAEVDQTIRTVSASLLDVSKNASDPSSRIFRDEHGHFEIREGETLTGRCEYALAAQLKLGEDAAIVVAGIKVEQGYEDAKLLEVTVADRLFEISREKTLADYEGECRAGFKAFEEGMRKDLAAALKSKVVIERVGDSRIDALQTLLGGQPVRFEHDGQNWEIEPVNHQVNGNSVATSGRIKQLGRWGARSYEFHHQFDASTSKINHIDLVPRGVDQVDQMALDLSVFFAQNVARRAASQGLFTVDASLLR